MKSNKPLDETLLIIKDKFEYNSETGILYRYFPAYNEIREVGFENDKGHLRVKINHKHFAVANVCWFLYYKKWPEFELDHEDRNKKNNKINNLREATIRLNAINKDRKSKYGRNIIYKLRKFQVEYTINKNKIILGRFKEHGDAVRVAAMANINYFNEYEEAFA